MIKVPKTCMVCDADWVGGCAEPGDEFPDVGLRVFYDCGASISIGENLGDGAYLVLVKNCGSEILSH